MLVVNCKTPTDVCSLDEILSYLPKQRRTGLFSATQTREVDDLIRAGLRNPVHIAVKERLSSDSHCEQRTPSTLHNYYMVGVANCRLVTHAVLSSQHTVLPVASYVLGKNPQSTDNYRCSEIGGSKILRL